MSVCCVLNFLFTASAQGLELNILIHQSCSVMAACEKVRFYLSCNSLVVDSRYQSSAGE